MKDFDHPVLYEEHRTVERSDEYVNLKPAEKVFVDAYLANLGRSAVAAGKTVADMLNMPEVDASARAAKLLQSPRVRAAIAQRARQISAKYEVSQNSLIKEIANIAFANMANYLHIAENGEPYISLSDCTYDQMSAIAEITVEDYKEGRGEDARDVRKVKLKLHDKQQAQEKLMRYLQLYAPERIDVNMTINSSNLNVNMTPQELAEMYQQRIKR